jgi:hypothetical protein
MQTVLLTTACLSYEESLVAFLDALLNLWLRRDDCSSADGRGPLGWLLHAFLVAPSSRCYCRLHMHRDLCRLSSRPTQHRSRGTHSLSVIILMFCTCQFSLSILSILFKIHLYTNSINISWIITTSVAARRRGGPWGPVHATISGHTPIAANHPTPGAAHTIGAVKVSSAAKVSEIITAVTALYLYNKCKKHNNMKMFSH